MKLRQKAYHQAVLKAHGMTRSTALPSRAARLYFHAPGRRIDIGGRRYGWALTGQLLRLDPKEAKAAA